MKTQIILLLVFCTLSFSSFAQPRKGSTELSGFGNFTKGKSESGDKTATFELNTSASYFVLRNLSAGLKIYYRGYKEYEFQSNPILDEFVIGPTIEAFIMNQEKIGISLKTSLNFTLGSDFAAQDNGYSSFIIGPKVAWNITPNLSTFLWFAYRDTKNSDDYTQNGSIIPSDNFDIRWGFSYYLHSKKQKE
ncbi:hypothetical protein [Maribellus sp. YY47]|uniref:hypothetical protein n=1 Tax=Maribellus sp. YY47 TaxID=2929486 RepID=UPI002001C652|nr:hypothetical protein [Maribellus sp. YY47]MCK3685787.1 hypothetical protein [Maribellus sp. YY47]